MKQIAQAYWELTIIVIICLVMVPGFVIAASSASYRIDEDDFDSGGGPEGSSSNFKVRDSAGGSVSGGRATSTTRRVDSGPITQDEPRLSFVVNTSSVSLGNLTTGSTGTGTATFSVLDYTSYGYVVTVAGNTLESGSNNIDALATPTASSAGTEQFGINLVANTSPTTFGANPAQVPSGTFSFGQASSGYNTTNLYKFVSGNTIAESTSESGQTDYTMSFIANIANSTAGGQYSATLNLVVVPTY